MNPTPFNQAMLSNIQKPCRAKGCELSRNGLSRYCRHHSRQASLYGDALAQPVSRISYKWALQKVRALFRSNANHEGYKYALAFIQQWIDGATGGDAAAVARVDIQRLIENGVTAEDILIEAASFSLWEHYNTGVLPSLRAVDFALSRAVLGLAPREKRIGTHSDVPMYVQPRNAVLQGIGAYLRENLSGFFANTFMAIEQEQSHLDAARAALKAPLAIPLSFFTRASADAPAVAQQ